ncbi:nuclear transport factor 2 family protein [Streptomyces griseoflavus]|uniref:Membrane protein n=1 Tax=Streptomyces griseoflavus Tu4000 TaxID=467200 RepID=D9XJX1_9ACTN|nr:nuclear transport factor 2 family protein [Streptomyces griseoflavus]EFL41510.1 membrane protein [Streptomyces griseoflavus Tu4000]
MSEEPRPGHGAPSGGPAEAGCSGAERPGGEGSADQPDADADADAGDGDGVPGRWGRGGRLRGVLLGGVAALLVAGGCGFLYGAHQQESDGAARNRALTDTGATDRVAGEVGNALARVFSYTPDGTAAAERSARTVLGGRAARQYQDLFGQVRDDLTEQRVTLSTRAVRTGVIELDGDRARLLVFLDQTSRRGDDAATTAAAQLTVTARLENDRWLIVDLKAR